MNSAKNKLEKLIFHTAICAGAPQIALMAEEKSPSQISLRPVADAPEWRNKMTNAKKEIAVLLDTEFATGFDVLAPKHPVRSVGVLRPAEAQSESTPPQWRIAQWACRYNAAEGEVRRQDNGYRYETDSQRVEVTRGGGETVLGLELRASREYVSPRQEGGDWPHLLIEQTWLGARCPTLDQLSSLRLTLDARIPYWACYMERPDPAIHTGQTSMFFTVAHVDTQDMYWFGIPIFDARYRQMREYMAEDGGKADATHKFIYIVDQASLTDVDLHTGDWMKLDVDILPLFQKGLTVAVDRGFLKSNAASMYTITSTNLGWEMPGTYDAALETVSYTHLL